MKISCLLIFFCFLFPLFAKAQPGGGGGLHILSFSNKADKPIAISKLKLNIYQFRNDKIYAKIEPQLGYRGDTIGVYLAPFNQYRKVDSTNFYRLIWHLDLETMMVDFKNIMPANGGGAVGRLSKLSFQKGYFEDASILNAKPKAIDTSFLLPKNLTANYHYNQAKKYLKVNPALFEEEINQIDTLEGQFSVHLYHHLLYQKAIIDINFEIALPHITKAIAALFVEMANDKVVNCTNELNLKRYFNDKIEVLKKLAQHEAVVETYQKLITYKFSPACTSTGSKEKLEQFNYSSKFIKNYRAIQDSLVQLNKVIISKTKANDYPYCLNESYFLQGQQFYLQNNKIKAKQYWEKAVKIGHLFSLNGNLDKLITYFTALQQKFPNDVPYYTILAHLISYRSIDYFHYEKDNYKIFANKVIKLALQAEKMGNRDYDSYILISRTYFNLNDINNTTKYLNKAITVDKNRIDAYYVQYEIDRDYNRFKELEKTKVKLKWTNYILVE